MKVDFANCDYFAEAEAIYTVSRRPGSGSISDASDVNSDGKRAVFTGAIVDRLDGAPATHICSTDLTTGETNVLTFGPNSDRLPKLSPDGKSIAFLSDRDAEGEFQLYLMDATGGGVTAAPTVEGWVEYLHWSPDGKQILLGVAGHGADIAGMQGAISTRQKTGDRPSWAPHVDTGADDFRWRSVWIFDCASGQVSRIQAAGLNVWEANWWSSDAVIAVTSDAPGEESWYEARLSRIDVATGSSREVHRPAHQLGSPVGAPLGRYAAFVEAICSDRWIVCGTLYLLDHDTGERSAIETAGVDVAFTEWRSPTKLLVAGHRGFETVVGIVDACEGSFEELWSSPDLTTGGVFVTVAGLNDVGDCALVGEGFLRAPELAVIRRGQYRCVRSFDLGYADQVKAVAPVEFIRWKAADGLEIDGWLLRPKDVSKGPLVVNVHGGPVWHWRPVWLARRSVFVLMLVNRGISVFFPNPRGSTGRGQAFVSHVLGDLGGVETYDFLSGVDYLVEQGRADPGRLGVTGGSYGGFMASWLITQDDRFAAAVTVAPHTNHVTEHLLSNVSHYMRLFVGDDYDRPSGKYHTRSPIMFAKKVTTPTLHICGALDRVTPPEEAIQFHRALLEQKVESVLVTYPEEGHGVRKWPAAIDYAARLVSWFDERLTPTPREP